MVSPDRTLDYIDSSNLEEIREVYEKSGVVSGVTTNPTNFSNSLPEGTTEEKALELYIERVVTINEIVRGKPISLQVPMDGHSTAQQIIDRAYSIYGKVPREVNVYLKLAITKAALDASHHLTRDKIPQNFTLVFSQVQLAAIHISTREAEPNSIFASAFIRRMYNPPMNPETNLPAIRQSNGMDIISNGRRLYDKFNSHVKILAASIGDKEDIIGATFYGADIITIPYKPFMEWVEAGLPLPDEDFSYIPKSENRIRYEEFDLRANNINRLPSLKHILTQLGLEAFNKDWNRPRKRT